MDLTLRYNPDAARPLLRQAVVLRFIATRMLIGFGGEMLAVALGWRIYALTGSAWSLALVGLVHFLPAMGLVLVTGHAADRFDRRRVVLASLVVQSLSALALLPLAGGAHPSVWPIYGALLVFGAAQAFTPPALSSTLPNLVTREEFPKAIAFSVSGYKMAMIAGPAAGGFVYAFVGVWVFAAAAALYALAAVMATGLPRRAAASGSDQGGTEGATLDRLLAGVGYVRSNPVLLGAISLDLFAVLLGGVTALLPIFASDILHAGPMELGLLRAGPAFGSVLVGAALAFAPLRRRFGAAMLSCVAGYGLATIAFALSTSLWLSLAALVALGAFDMVSVVIRQTLVQIATPDAMRGRVSAISWVFIGASNQLGEFESGAVAALLGAAPAALAGGAATLVVVALWAVWFPELRAADGFEAPGQGRAPALK